MKRLRFQTGPLDATDAIIVRALARDARTAMSELAREVGMSAPSITERVRRLEEAGVIRGYQAVVDPAALGLVLAVHIRIRPMPGLLAKVADVLRGLDPIIECDRVTGEDCFIAKAYVRDVAELEALIDEINPHAMTTTSIIQSSPVKRRMPPIKGEGTRG
ncbi:AsnC family transcriptional regulator (plasmid) [Microvirga ossetica]|uniref:AsnC family transcriptional regulator n=1 Tax=Microvirga ossetica TaxID=1882682 RepID=A0A1B2EVQ4_9HYPH|nr:Lrp/AsnC family transcriptional regulator [Microvirga ossetica]ANY84047.1 AsnC family transcriptional regulator [Microvirga ossetica]